MELLASESLSYPGQLGPDRLFARPEACKRLYLSPPNVLSLSTSSSASMIASLSLYQSLDSRRARGARGTWRVWQAKRSGYRYWSEYRDVKEEVGTTTDQGSKYNYANRGTDRQLPPRLRHSDSGIERRCGIPIGPPMPCGSAGLINGSRGPIGAKTLIIKHAKIG